jgi:UDP-GlcNAc:undecaprenyl-phosphate GlcNAc-1-phosphate transferase
VPRLGRPATVRSRPVIPCPTLLAVALAAAIVSFATTRLAAFVARRLGALDRPAGYKAHREATPLLGGVGVATGTCLAICGLSGWRGDLDRVGLLALGSGSLVVLCVGLLDDLHGLSAGTKLAWQVVAAACAGLVLAAFGVRLSLFLGWPVLPLMGLTALWVVGITNAFNFADNMNGLCAGLGAVAAAFLALANLRSGETTVALAAAALAGGCLGFLPANWPRARIFLGDAGSMFIGFSLAGLSVMGVYTPGARVPGLAVLVPLLILAVPVLDLLGVVGLRLRAGDAFWRGDRRHLSHRLVRRGLKPAAAVAVLWGVGFLSGVVALALPQLAVGQALALLGGLLLALIGLLVAAGARGLP